MPDAGRPLPILLPPPPAPPDRRDRGEQDAQPLCRGAATTTTTTRPSGSASERPSAPRKSAEDSLASISTDDESASSKSQAGRPPRGLRSRAPLLPSMSGEPAGIAEAAPTWEPPVRRVRMSLDVERISDDSPVATQPEGHVGKRCRPVLLTSTASPTVSSSSPPPDGEGGEDGTSAGARFLLPGVSTRRVRLNLPACEETLPTSAPPSPAASAVSAQEAPQQGARRLQGLKLATPSSCTSAINRHALTPTTPDPCRDGFKFIDEDLDIVFFDFDGTLTETRGEANLQRWEKKAELLKRAPMLRARLRGMREAGLSLGIISKSTEQTIREAIEVAGLVDLFDGPIIGKALGFEGKAGFIEDMYLSGQLQLGPEGLRRVLLVDDDVRELDRARERGIQTFAAPEEGGLQDADFDEIFLCMSLPSPRATSEGSTTA